MLCCVVLVLLYFVLDGWFICSQISFRALPPEETVLLRVPADSDLRQSLTVSSVKTEERQKNKEEEDSLQHFLSEVININKYAIRTPAGTHLLGHSGRLQVVLSTPNAG